MPGPTKCNGPRWCYLRSSGGVRCQTMKLGARMVAILNPPCPNPPNPPHVGSAVPVAAVSS